MRQLIIVGASGHGKVVADIASKLEYDKIVFLDDNPCIKECGGYPVIGPCKAFASHQGDVIIAIGNAVVRKKMQSLLTDDRIPVLVHPNAVVAQDVKIGVGTVVMACAVINPGTTIGKGCIINTCASVDHDCVVGDYVHVSVGAHVAGTVRIDEGTWIGAGATVSNNLHICGNCMIGAGSVVVKDIVEADTYVGVPAVKK